MKIFDNNLRRFLIVFFLLLVVVSGCAKSKVNKTEINSNLAVPVKTDVELDKEYEAAIKQILLPFWQSQESVGIRQKILDVRAPANYLDLHINLVFTFDLLEQGSAAGDQEKIENALERIDGLVQDYPWLK